MREIRLPRWFIVLAVGLLTPTANAEQQDFRINQPQDRPWKVNDTVCVARNGQTVCGKVVRADSYEAVVRPKMTGRGVQVILDAKPKKIAPPAPTPVVVPVPIPVPAPTPPPAPRQPTAIILPSTITMKTEPAEPPRRTFSATAGILVGTTYLFPSLQLEFALSEKASLGAIGIYAKGTSSGNELTAAGALLGLSYFIVGKAPLGFFLQGGGGVYSLKGRSPTREDNSSSPVGFVLLGWRAAIARGITGGAGLGVQYVKGDDASAIRFRGLLPLCQAQIGFSL